MKKTKKKGGKIVLVTVIIIILIILAIAFRMLTKKTPEAQISMTSVEVLQPTEREIVNYTEQIGTISPAESVTVIPKISGEVLALHVNVGDSVQAGAVLANLNADALSGLKIQMDSAKIAMNDAQTALTRTTELFAAGAVSQQNLEQARSAASSAKLAYDAAKNQYDLQSGYTALTSPIAGVIEAKNLEVHGMAQAGSPAFVVSAQNGTTVKFGVTEPVKAFIKVGDSLTVEKDGKIYTGRITEIEEMVSASSGLYNVKASVEKAEEMATGSRVKLSLMKAKEQVKLSVPISAVYYSGGQPYVYLYKEGKAVKTKVQTGIYDAEYIAVTEGLQAEDKVIYTWSKELYDGANVSLADEQAPEESAAQTGTDAAN